MVPNHFMLAGKRRRKSGFFCFVSLHSPSHRPANRSAVDRNSDRARIWEEPKACRQRTFQTVNYGKNLDDTRRQIRPILLLAKPRFQRHHSVPDNTPPLVAIASMVDSCSSSLQSPNVSRLPRLSNVRDVQE